MISWAKRLLRKWTSRGPKMTDLEALEHIVRSELCFELLTHYLVYRKAGDTPNEALGSALWDWDL
jgi:hypothetical protein